jgi:hypothetical protein
MAKSAQLVGVSHEEIATVPSGGYIASQFVQAPSGLAGFVDQPFAAPYQGPDVTIRTAGNVQLPCASATLASAGDAAWWDSANDTLLPYPAAAGWYAGTFQVAKVDGATTAIVALNRLPKEQPVLTKTADYTLTVADSGSTVSTTGASGTVVLSLPAAVPGLRYTGRVGAAQELRFDPNGSETISLPSTGVPGAAGKYLTANAIGETVELVCVVAGTWSVLGYTGTWTAEA